MSKTRMAWMVALAADALQIVFLPLFAGGWASPLSNGLDVAVALIMIAVLGLHWAFLPTAIAEIVPALNLFPTWTAAVFFVTRGRARNEARRKEIPPGAVR